MRQRPVARERLAVKCINEGGIRSTSSNPSPPDTRRILGDKRSRDQTHGPPSKLFAGLEQKASLRLNRQAPQGRPRDALLHLQFHPARNPMKAVGRMPRRYRRVRRNAVAHRCVSGVALIVMAETLQEAPSLDPHGPVRSKGRSPAIRQSLRTASANVGRFPRRPLIRSQTSGHAYEL